MNPQFITGYLLVEAHEYPQGQVAEALQGVLTDEMRIYAGRRSALIDWAATTSRRRSCRPRFSTNMRPTG
jgi:hypothetical protein